MVSEAPSSEQVEGTGYRKWAGEDVVGRGVFFSVVYFSVITLQYLLIDFIFCNSGEKDLLVLEFFLRTNINDR